MREYGALPDRLMRQLIEGGFIKSASMDGINPSSMDVTLSDEIYRVDGIFQPMSGEKIRKLLKKIGAKKHSFAYPLERGVTYLAKLNETFKLPSSVYGHCNPKSSTGRVDLHVRVLADGSSRYDTLAPAGYSGEVWIAISPKSFPILLAPGERLAQIRFFSNGSLKFNDLELQLRMGLWGLLFDLQTGKQIEHADMKITDQDGSIILTLDMECDPIGYKCAGTSRVFDFTKRNYYKPEDFFEEITRDEISRNGYLSLRGGDFYILSTIEAVRIDPRLACEMEPVDAKTGEMRSHYAGFIDPGWGWGANLSGIGRTLTLEVRPFENLIVRHGQPIGKIRFERLVECSEKLYDAMETSNYVDQNGPRLSKHFRRS